jgi:hypothetical protein
LSRGSVSLKGGGIYHTKKGPCSYYETFVGNIHPNIVVPRRRFTPIVSPRIVCANSNCSKCLLSVCYLAVFSTSKCLLCVCYFMVYAPCLLPRSAVGTAPPIKHLKKETHAIHGGYESLVVIPSVFFSDEISTKIGNCSYYETMEQKWSSYILFFGQPLKQTRTCCGHPECLF